MANQSIIAIEIKVNDNGSVTMKQFEANAGQALQKVSDSASSSASLIGKLKSSWVELTAAAYAAGVAFKKAMAYIEQGAASQQGEASFRSVAAAANESADGVLAAMKRASAGTIEETDLMQKAAKGLILGLKGEEMVKIMEAARISARVTGQDVKTTYETITDAISTNMPRALKQYGLITKQEMTLVNQALAEGIDDVGLYEIAMANAALQAAKVGTVAIDAKEQLQIFKAGAKETADTIGNFLIRSLQVATGFFQWLAAGVLTAASGFPLLLKYMDLASAKFFEMTGQDDRAKAYRENAEVMGKAVDDMLGASGELAAKGMDNILGQAAAAKAGDLAAIQSAEKAKAAADAKLAAMIGAVQQRKMALETMKAENKAYFAEEEARIKYNEEIRKLAGENELQIGRETLAERATLIDEYYDRSKKEIILEEAARAKTDRDKVSAALFVAQKMIAMDADVAAKRYENRLQIQLNNAKTLEFMKSAYSAYVTWEKKQAADLIEFARHAGAGRVKIEADVWDAIALYEKMTGTKVAPDQKNKIGIDALMAEYWGQSKELAEYYSTIGGYEDKYRQNKLDWIDKEEKRLAAFYGDDVAAAKWAAEQKRAANFQYASSMKDALGEWSTALEYVSQLYDQGSAKQKQYHEMSMAFALAQKGFDTANAVVKGVEAVINAMANGDGYTAIARGLAVAAVVASYLAQIGASFSGSGGSYPVKAAAYGQNTTVLGGANDQGSESIQKSWELLQGTYDMENTKLTGIYNEMKDLNSNITGLVTSLIRGGGTFTASETMIDLGQTSPRLSAIAAKYSLYADKIFAAIDQWLWGSTTTSQSGSGIGVDAGSIQEIIGNRGASVSPYKWGNWVTNRDGGLFGSDSTSLTGENSALDDASVRMMRQVYASLSSAIITYGQAFGADMDKIYAYSFGNLAVNLMGKTSEEISKAISEAISTMSDTAANALLGDVIGQYQKLNEGLLETASRLLIDKAVIADVLDMTGQTYSGTIPQMIAFSEALIEIAGGLDKLQEAAATYYDKFFSDEEKQLRLQGQLTDSLAAMNMALPGNWAGYRQLVEGLDLTTTAGQKAYVALLQMSEMADQYYQAQLDNAEKLLSVAEDNLKKAFDAEKKRLTDTYNLELAGMNTTLDATKAIIADLKSGVDKLRTAKERMKLVDAAADHATFMRAQVDLANVLEKARKGDLSGLKDVQKSVDILTGITPEMYANSTDYKRDFMTTYAAISELEKYAGAQLGTAEKSMTDQELQISILTKNYDANIAWRDAQMNALLGIDTSVLSVADAIAALQLAQAAVVAAGGTIAPPLPPPIQPNEIEANYQALFGRAAEDIGKQYYQKTGLTGGALTTAIHNGAQKLDIVANEIIDNYQRFFGRVADSEGLAWYLGTGLTGSALESAMLGGAKTSWDISAHESRGFADGGISTGPYSGYGATLHGTELIVSPRTSYPATVYGSKDQASNAELISELRALTVAIEKSGTKVEKNTGDLSYMLNSVIRGGLTIKTEAPA